MSSNNNPGSNCPQCPDCVHDKKPESNCTLIVVVAVMSVILGAGLLWVVQWYLNKEKKKKKKIKKQLASKLHGVDVEAHDVAPPPPGPPPSAPPVSMWGALLILLGLFTPTARSVLVDIPCNLRLSPHDPKGYTIPLDKRLAADRRGLQEVQINDNFAKLSEALYVAREAVAMRSEVQKEMMMKEKERKAQDFRALAKRARSERTGSGGEISLPPDRSMVDDGDNMMVDFERVKEKDAPRETKEEREKRMEREKIREERRRERERERRLEAKDAEMGKKCKITRGIGPDLDVSEKVALGMASTNSGRGGEVMYDRGGV